MSVISQMGLCLSALLAATLVGCVSSQDASDDFEPVATQHGGMVCGETMRGYRSDGSPRVEREIYYFAPMNARLARFPELAAALGASEVTSCDGARAFSRKYRELKLAQPELDDVEPDQAYLDWLERAAPPPPPDASSGTSDEDVAKILNGVPEVPAAVESKLPIIRFLSAIDTTECSGTFISDRWILTAAHCAPDPSIPGPVKDDKWRAAKIRIQQLDAGGTPMLVAGRILDVVFYPYPGYFGAGNAENDVALIFIYPERFLYTRPANDGGLYEPGYGGAYPLATGDILPGHKLEPWGWGYLGQATPSSTLTGPPLDANGKRTQIDISIADHASRVFPQHLDLPFDPSSEPRICVGDSGGPLLRPLPEGVTLNPSYLTYKFLIQGVISEIRSFGHCGETEQSFARVDTIAKRNWIEKMIRQLSWEDNRFTSCELAPLKVGNSDYGHARCWRRYCDSQKDCKFAETCGEPEAGRLKRCIEGQFSP